jgi:hypothetical protein
MTWLQIRLFLLTLLVFCLLVILAPVAALAQASSQPSTPRFILWLKVNWWWILIVLGAALPTFITALSRYPKAHGIISVLQIIADLLSINTHKDSPNSMKAPFTRSKPPTGQMKIGMRGPKAAATTALVLFLALGVTSCCILKPGTCKTAYGNCAAEVARQEFPDALGLVEAALSGSTPEIVVESLDLLSGLGKGLILCCVQSVRDKYAPASQPASGPAMKAASPKALKILQNADAYLKLRGVK